MDNQANQLPRRLIGLLSVALAAIALVALGLVVISRRRERAIDPCPPEVAATRELMPSPDMTPISGQANAGGIAGGPGAVGMGSTIFDFYLLSHKDPSLPKTIAIANGVPVQSGDYEGRLAMYEGCIRFSCPGSAIEKSLGAENIALTTAVVNTLVEQYGAKHGITVSQTDITNALTQQATALDQGIALGGSAAELVRRDLGLRNLTEPSQIVGDPGWRQNMCHILMRGKTIDALALQELPADERGPMSIPTGRTKLEGRLLRTADVQVKIHAHLLSEAAWIKLATTPVSPPLPPALPPGPPPVSAPASPPGAVRPQAPPPPFPSASVIQIPSPPASGTPVH